MTESKRYKRFDNTVDKFIKKHGVIKATRILEQLSGEEVKDIKDSNMMIKDLCFNNVPDRCGITLKQMMDGNTIEDQDARMICFSLLYKFSTLSYDKIGGIFGMSKQGVMKSIKKMTEVLDEGNPSYKKAIKIYSVLNQEVESIIDKIKMI